MAGLGQRWRNWWLPIIDPMVYIRQQMSADEDVQDARHLLQKLEALLRRQQLSMTGHKHSILKGHGLDFADLREYIPGDDIRKIDWNVFARTLVPHVKEFEEDKQLNIWLFIDFSPSMRFGQRRSKADLAVELAGLLGLMAQSTHHRLGFYLWDGREAEILPPKSSYGHLQYGLHRMLDRLQNASESGDGLAGQLQQLAQIIRRHQKNSTVILLSDFWDNRSLDEPLVALAQVSHPLFFLLLDPSERRLPRNVGLLPLRDPETGAGELLDTMDPAAVREYEALMQTSLENRLSALRKRGTVMPAETDQGAAAILTGLLTQARRTVHA